MRYLASKKRLGDTTLARFGVNVKIRCRTDTDTCAHEALHLIILTLAANVWLLAIIFIAIVMHLFMGITG